ncbi:Uncharacterized protein FKW44_010420, partial [Caligus rogercresseyi]
PKLEAPSKTEASSVDEEEDEEPTPGPSGLQEPYPSSSTSNAGVVVLGGNNNNNLSAPDLQLDCLLSSDTEDEESNEDDVRFVKISRKKAPGGRSSKKRPIEEVDLTQESDNDDDDEEDEEVRVEMIHNNGASYGSSLSSPHTSSSPYVPWNGLPPIWTSSNSLQQQQQQQH